MNHPSHSIGPGLRKRVGHECLSSCSGLKINSSEQTILDSIQFAFRLDGCIPAGLVVSVKGCWVSLSGQVEKDFQRLRALNAVNRIVGVKGVTDKIVLKERGFPNTYVSRSEAKIFGNAMGQTIESFKRGSSECWNQ